MEARLRFKPETLHQTGSAGKVLLWMQTHPAQCRNTNNTVLAKSMELGGAGINMYNGKLILQKMINNQMIHRHGGRKRSDFAINYFHKDIPGYILENAPDDIKERVERMNSELKPNQHIRVEGCVVTEPEKEAQEPEVDTTTEPELEVQETVESNPTSEEETLKSSSDASEENTTSTPITIRETERGLSISITLNLNINK